MTAQIVKLTEKKVVVEIDGVEHSYKRSRIRYDGAEEGDSVTLKKGKNGVEIYKAGSGSLAGTLSGRKMLPLVCLAAAAIIIIAAVTGIGKNAKTTATKDSGQQNTQVKQDASSDAGSAEEKTDNNNGFTIRFQDGGQNPDSFIIEGSSDTPDARLYLYDADTDEQLGQLKGESNLKLAKSMAPLCFVGVTGLTEKEQNALGDKLNSLKTVDDVMMAFIAGSDANGGDEVSFDTEDESKNSGNNDHAREVVRAYINGTYKPDNKFAEEIKKEIADGYGELNKTTYSIAVDIEEPYAEEYNFYIADASGKKITGILRGKTGAQVSAD